LIPTTTGIGFCADVRPDGRKYRYSLRFSSSEFEASAIQKRLLSHTLVHSNFPHTIATTDAGVKRSRDTTLRTRDIGLQAGDQVIPLEEATAGGMARLGTDLAWSTGFLVASYGDRMRWRVISRRVVVCDSKFRCKSFPFVNVFEFQSNIFC